MPRIIPFVLFLLIGTTSFAMNNSETNSILETEDVRVSVATWAPQVNIQSDCQTAQRFFESEQSVSGTVITQSFTPCQTGTMSHLLVNAVFDFIPQQSYNFTTIITDGDGGVVATGTATFQEGDSHLTFVIGDYDFMEDTEYSIKLNVPGQLNLIYQASIDSQFYAGTMTIDGTQVDQNLCFIGLMHDSDATDHETGEEHEEETEEDPHSDIHWGPHGIKPPLDREELRHLVYPNPFVQDFQIEIDTKAEVAGTIALYNFMGKKVFDQAVPNMADMKKMQVSPFEELTKGYYTLRIEYGDNIILDTVVKQ